MESRRYILLVLENGVVENAVVAYAAQLTLRMGCAISLLMLVPNGKESSLGPDLTTRRMKEAADLISVEGLTVTHDIKVGDKASELLKFIAVAPNIAAIVWGSDGDIMTGRRRRKTEHWFEKVRPWISCPIVTPKTRAKKDRLSGHAKQK